MATRGERQALLFLTAVALLGAGTRLYRARRVGGDVSGVEAQLGAVDRARTERPAKKPRRSSARAAAAAPVDSAPRQIDLDQAPATEIERLPGIGPALAMRIVAEREANGPFGCLRSLDEVKGVGPALLRRIDSLAVFSGPPRESCIRGGSAPSGSG
jgi:competence protein ComEA